MNAHSQNRPPDPSSGARSPALFPAAQKAAGQQAASIPAAGLTAIFQNLIKVTHDGEHGFQHAAAQVHDRALRDEFHKYARERRSMASELTQLMNLVGEGTTAPSGSATAAFHRTWMSLRTVFSEEPNDQAILDEVERGEEAAEEAFHEVLDPTDLLPEVVRSGIETLAEKVHRAHERVRRLRDSGLYQRPQQH